MDLAELKPHAVELGEAYRRLCSRTDSVSRYIVSNMDPEIVKVISSAHRLSDDASPRAKARGPFEMQTLPRGDEVPDACFNR